MNSSWKSSSKKLLKIEAEPEGRIRTRFPNDRPRVDEQQHLLYPLDNCYRADDGSNWGDWNL